MKKILRVIRDADKYWVGDGFPVRTLFSYDDRPEEISPFLLLDHAGPARFAPHDHPRGVGFHPHRGFETVTIVYHGEVEHRDTAGNHGKIGPGDVQWMTAAGGVLHEEMHGRTFTEKGGVLEMVQLWVNLPAKDKMSPPRYQEILDRMIPRVPIEGGNGLVRVISGNYQGAQGPAKTFTPLDLWDMRLGAGHALDLRIEEGRTAAVLVRKGRALLSREPVAASELVLFEQRGRDISIRAEEDLEVLLMHGEPIREPVAGHGPFVMNTEQEIRRAMEDFSKGRF
jgi:hypothetical protein